MRHVLHTNPQKALPRLRRTTGGPARSALFTCSGMVQRRLTQREVQVLALVAHGHTTAEIAAALALSPRTVEMHRANALRALGITTRAEIVRWAIQTGHLET